jgi:hypothetical protein
LWVSFDLGRPFGPPNDAEFQRRVLSSALELLEVESGPVIVDFPDDEPATDGDQNGWACPINFSRPEQELTGSAAIAAALKNEFAQFAPWYDKAVEKHGRTTVGVSGLELDDMANLFGAMLDDALPPSPVEELPLADVVRLSAQDVKAYMTEAASAQPGDAGARQLAEWFWNETATGGIFKQLRDRCLASEDEAIKLLGIVLLVPTSQAA